ncbi:PREDICTED: odorant receptor 13a-like isoform X1 [Ceratosolen solmsi marchali]|uniref:Odorant receptor n=1 Tax=Ceratosolen solmsi marchali TaxID=326594 RepID=A0AAJ6YVH6_9HYME|nr:PREDICTED: odorant receptor 13a-like isoform X1 [Ceratosolen solmsi marchali]
MQKFGASTNFDDYIFLNRWALTFLGMWTIDNRFDHGVAKILHRLHITFLFVLMLLLIIPQWLDLYIFWGNINANAETVVLNVFTITAILKLLCCILTANVFNDVLMSLKSDWNETMDTSNPAKEKHREILLKMASSAFNYTKQYAFIMYVTALLYFISPFVGMQPGDLRIRKYPFFGWYHFDRFSNLNYGICYVSQVMSGTVVGTTNFAMDSIFLVSLYHHSAQLQILQHDLAELVSAGCNSANVINNLIKKHQKYIRISQMLQVIFNGSSLQQLLISCVIICVIGLKLIIALEDGGYESLIYIMFMGLALLQILLYCQSGDVLISESLQVGYATYQSPWTSVNLSSIRSISLMILRSQKPLTISAGKIYVLSLQNFTMVT